MRYLLICVLLTLTQAQTTTATAVDVVFQPLATITNDRNADLQNLGVLLVVKQVVGLRFDTVNGKNPHESYFSLHDMQRGAVLDGDGKHKAVVLQGSIDSTVGNADLIITYLSNGVLRKHKDCHVGLVRDEMGQWHIVNTYDHKWVDHLVIQTWRLGILTIHGICPPPNSRTTRADEPSPDPE